MELLLELIVWIFKSVFGDPEKTVDTTKLNRKPPLRQDRGSYTYGDESSGSAPKTLEEILEEARRQASQRRDNPGSPGGAMKPTPPRPVQSTQPRPTTRTVLDTESESTTPVIRTVVSREVAEEPSRPFESVSRPAPQPQPQLSPKQRRQAENLSRRPTQVAAPLPVAAATAQAQPLQQRPQPQPQKKKGAPQQQVLAVPDLLQAIRAASSADKREAARQAIVMLEIFGPPRSRRGFRPGGRGF